MLQTIVCIISLHLLIRIHGPAELIVALMLKNPDSINGTGKSEMMTKTTIVMVCPRGQDSFVKSL